MPFQWSAPRPGAFRDAYLDWSQVLGRRLDALPPQRPEAQEVYEPIFVRLVDNADPVVPRRALQEALAASPELLIDPHEATLLARRITAPETWAALPDEYALYRRLGTPDSDHAALFTVLDTGVPVRLEDTPKGSQPVASDPATPSTAPIVAIIDDGIGFLNARFCRHGGSGTTRTRFRAIWLQALESKGSSGGITAGEVLDSAAVDALLRKDEAGAYAALNARLHGGDARPATAFSTSHGTQVLDLAAGAAPDDATDPVRDWPLLGVQLPPEAVDDTSGSWFESYILQGLRWILRKAVALDPKAPVIVNLSLGVTAGPKDGSRFLERQMAREAANWEAATGQPVRLVWSFGNSYRHDLIATQSLSTEAPKADLTCRVQPDDMTASYVEIRTRGAETSALSVAVVTPDGIASGFDTLAPGENRSLEDARGPVARLYHVAARDRGFGVSEPAHYVLALAPTQARKSTETVATPGAWRIALRHEGGGEVQALLQIQRDDSLGGSSLRGRQAYFDDARAYGWDGRFAAYLSPEDTGPITRNGSHNALATVPAVAARQVFSAGAAGLSARSDGHDPMNFLPAYYTAAGADWSVPGPTVSTLIEESAFAPGAQAAGTLSGTTRRIGGTSAAAGRLSRALGLSAAKIVDNTGKPDSVQTDDLDVTALNLYEVPAERAARLGAYVVDVPKRAATEALVG